MTMFAPVDERTGDSRSHRIPEHNALESLASDRRLDSTYAPGTTSNSGTRPPSINLPAHDFSSPPTPQQTAHDFPLPVRGRYEPHLEHRRVSAAAFSNVSSGASHLATPQAGAWYSKEGYQQAVAQFQARRSRSQPPTPGVGAPVFQQQSSHASANMSAFAPILPSPSSHFGQSSEFFASSAYSPHLGYDSMTALPDQSYFGGVPDHASSTTISPRLLPSSNTYGVSTPRTASKPISRSPPTRERTPIRHHRPSLSRARSSSRPEALLAYAEQHQHPGASSMPMQSPPNTSPAYTAYSMPTTSAPSEFHSAYYAAPTMPLGSSQYLTAHSPYASDPNSTSYFGLTRSVSQPTLDLTTLNPQDAIYLPNPTPVPSTSPPLPSLGSNLQSFPPPVASLESSPEGFRVLASRPKPQCFDHGCNGRQFSTFSNLLRHQREKSGSAMKAVCPHCGTEFTRTTARNGHLWGGKCKGRGGDGQEGASEDAPSTAGSD